MTRPGLMVGTYDYVADTRYSWGGFAIRFSGEYRAVRCRSAPSDSRTSGYTTDQPNGTGSVYFRINETFVGLTFAQNFSDRLRSRV